jgi:aminoglycoside/choline kinase family phosphotransferase
MLSELALLTLSYTGDAGEAPATLVVKFPTLNEINRAIAKDFKVYQREVRSYLEIVPNSPAASPKVHLADIEGDVDFVIVLEDLSDYRVGDQVEGATFEESGLALKELAKLHGTFWGKVDSEEFEWMPRFSNSWNATNMLEGSKASWELAAENFDECIPQWIRDIKGDFFKTLPMLQKHLDTDPITAIHGDFRLDNLFFGQEPHHHKMTFIDWQGPVRGRGVVEVAFLLSQSTKTEVRRAHEKELIQQYLDALEAQGVSGYSFDEAWEDYRIAVLYQWCFATLVAGSMDQANDRGNAWMTEMVKRNVAAIEDLNCLDLL